MYLFSIQFILAVYLSIATAQVTILAPSSFTIGDPVILRCTLGGTLGYTDVTNIQFSRNTSGTFGNDDSKIVSVSYNRTAGASVISWQNGVIAHVSATGSVDIAADAYLELNFTSATCEENGAYRCRVVGSDAGSNILDNEEDTFVFANATPGAIDAISTTAVSGQLTTVMIDGKTGGLANNDTVIHFNCSGSVGSPPTDLRWCVKKHGGNFSEVVSVQSDAMSTGSCDFKKWSTFNFTVSLNETLTVIQCEARGSYECGMGPNNKQFVVTTNRDQVQTTTAPSSSYRTKASITLFASVLVVLLL